MSRLPSSLHSPGPRRVLHLRWVAVHILVRQLRRAFYNLVQNHGRGGVSRMPATIEPLTHDALTVPTLSVRLAQTLLRSLNLGVEEGVEVAWNAEVARRLSRVHQGTANPNLTA